MCVCVKILLGEAAHSSATSNHVDQDFWIDPSSLFGNQGSAAKQDPVLNRCLADPLHRGS